MFAFDEDTEIIEISDDDESERSPITIAQEEDAWPAGLVFGYDPGTTNAGLAWLDAIGKRAYIYVVDFHTLEDGRRYRTKDLGPFLAKILQRAKFKSLFQHTTYAGIEIQNHPDSNKEVILVSTQLVQTIRVLYPQVHIFHTRGQDVRTLLKTKGKHHAQRKDLSMTTGILSDVDHATYVFRFQKPGKGLLYDGMEALEIAIYVAHSYKILLSKEEKVTWIPCSHGCIEMQCAKVDIGPSMGVPPPKPRKKRALAAAAAPVGRDGLPTLDPPKKKRRKLTAPPHKRKGTKGKKRKYYGKKKKP